MKDTGTSLSLTMFRFLYLSDPIDPKYLEEINNAYKTKARVSGGYSVYCQGVKKSKTEKKKKNHMQEDGS